MRRSGEDERWREERPIENYGKKEQKEWLDNILPDPHPFTAGNKEEENMYINLCTGTVFHFPALPLAPGHFTHDTILG